MNAASKQSDRGSAARSRLPEGVRATVIGGGLAGIAAATVLCERGAAVTVVEREPVLGGRASGWRDHLSDGQPFEMERGFHAFFRQYYNVRALLRRIDPELGNLMPLVDYPIVGPSGEMESFSGLPTRTPFQVLELVRRSPHLKLKDLMRADVRSAAQMLAFDTDTIYERFDHFTARQYLDSLSFPTRARQMLFDVFAHSFFNPEDRMSASELLMMFHFYFMGNPEGLVFDVLVEPFSLALWMPMRRYLEKRGVQFLLERSATQVSRATEKGWRVHLDKAPDHVDGDVVVLATTVPGLQSIVQASPDLQSPAWRKNVESQSVTYPFAVWRAWLDTPSSPGRHAFIGTSGLGVVDNVSEYHLFEGESRRWSMATGGSVVEVHAYAVRPELSQEAIRSEFDKTMREIYPETANARIVDERFLLRSDCPAFPPGSWRSRLQVETPFDGVALAGDFVRISQPSALMERAVSTGFLAANRLMSTWGVRPEPVRSVPTQGLLSWLPAWTAPHIA
ncbi:MAG: FAD-dependent oxidoreductase [Deltaproteobacteria bacterium]|nr:FAD-dependent oxidoreductase [Deltaproteobacteria bacterium]